MSRFTGEKPLLRVMVVALWGLFGIGVAGLPGRRAQADDLAMACRRAMGDFDARAVPTLAAAQRRLRAAMDDLDVLLSTAAPDEQARWRDFFAWDVASRAAATPRPDVGALQACVERLYADVAGVDRPAALAYRAALDDLCAAVDLRARPSIEDTYRARMAELARLLEAYSVSLDRERATAIAQNIAWLERAGQAPEVLALVRAQRSRPNCHVQASLRFIKPLVVRDIDATSTMSATLFGARVRGDAETRGALDVRFVPNPDRAVIELVADTTTVVRSVGTRQRVSVYSRATTDVLSRQRLIVDAAGIRREPIRSQADATLQFNGLDAPNRLIRRIAQRRVRQLAPQSEAVVSRRVTRRVEGAITTNADELCDAANRAFEESIRGPLTRLGLMPEDLRFSTTASAIGIYVLQADSTQLGSPTDPPPFAQTHDVAVAVHESLPCNLFDVFAADKPIRDSDLRDMIKTITGEVPREFRIGTHMQRWSLRGAAVDPVRVRFADQQVEFQIRASACEVGAESFDQPLEITARYDLVRLEIGPKLVRTAPVGIAPSTGGAIDPALDEFLHRKCAALFAEEIYFDGFAPPAGGRFEPLAELELREARAVDGWLLLGFQCRESTDAGSLANDAPDENVGGDAG